MPRTTPKVVWLICDAAAYWVTRRLLEEGSLPAFKYLATHGTFAAAQPPSPNCQTPPSLATLFTGRWPWQHGVSGFSVPDITPTNPITASLSGFHPTQLQAEPIWQWVQKYGKYSALSNIPWVAQNDGSIPEGCLFSLNGYSRRITRGNAITLPRPGLQNDSLQIQVGPYLFSIDCSTSMTVSLTLDATGEKVLLPVHDEMVWTSHFFKNAPEQGISFSVWQHPVTRDSVLCYTGIWELSTSPTTLSSHAQAPIGPFIGEGLGFVYRRGEFGPRLMEGGDGSAERMLVSTIAQAATFFQKASLFVNSYADADLSISYQPCIDDIEHELLGWCDPASKVYHPAIAAQTWDALRAVYQLADEHLAQLINHFGNDCTFIVSSDHGMAGMIATIHVNEMLHQHGLLHFTAKGEIDLARTAIIYHPANNGSLWVNDEQRPGGIVPHTKKSEIVQEAVQLLRQLRHPETNELVIHAIYPDDGEHEVGWAPQLGDLFLAAEDGYELSAYPSSTGESIVPTRKSASHATYPVRASLQGIFLAMGPGIPSGVNLAHFDNRQVFPVICKQLACPAPADLPKQFPPSWL